MKFFKNLFKKREFTKEQKEKYALIGGIAGLLVGFWMIFFTASKYWGFIPSIMGAILLIFGRRW